MGTANFYNKNASKYFIIEDNDEEEENDFIFDDTVESVTDLLKTSAKENRRDFYNGKISIDNNRNFDTTPLCSYSDGFTFCNSYLEAQIIPVIRSGYYSGANLDYEKEFKIDGESYTEVSEVLEHIAEYGSNAFKLNLSKFEKRIEELEQNLINEVEKVFESYSEPYVCIGRFSNGEALYEKFNDLSEKVDTPEIKSKEKGIGE